MPAEFTVDKATRMVYSRAFGTLDFAAISGHVRGVSEHPDFEPSFSQLFDFRELEGFEVSSAEVAMLATMNPFGSGARRALVVANELQFGMGRVYQARADESGNEIQIFYDRQEAEEWLECIQSSRD